MRKKKAGEAGRVTGAASAEKLRTSGEWEVLSAECGEDKKVREPAGDSSREEASGVEEASGWSRTRLTRPAAAGANEMRRMVRG